MKQSEIAVNYGIEYRPTIWCHEYNTYVFFYLMKNSVGTLKKESVCSEKILTLIKYDTEKNTEYYHTLLTFFQCRFNSTVAAKELFIQRSTFQYRMERIISLTDLDLNSFEELQYCYISFGILENT